MNDGANKWDIQKVRLEDASLMGSNPRIISKKSLEGLRESIGRFGYVEPIVWNQRTGHIVGGHQRYSILVEEGVIEATMVVVDLPSDEEMAANLTLNNPAIQGTWDDPIGDLLKQVKDGNEALYDALNMDALRSSLEKAGADGDQDWDTECPCCGHKWSVEPDDVRVEEEA